MLRKEDHLRIPSNGIAEILNMGFDDRAIVSVALPSLRNLVAEIEALRALIRVAVEADVLDELGFHGQGMATSLLPGEWHGVIARALADNGSAEDGK